MGRVPKDDVMAYRVAEGKIVCDNCVRAEELLKLKEDDILIVSEQKGAFYFCDRCKKQIV